MSIFLRKIDSTLVASVYIISEEALANDVKTVVGLRRHIAVSVDLVEDLVENCHQHVQSALIAPHRIAVVVMAIEDREADAHQRRSCVPLQVLPIGVADE